MAAGGSNKVVFVAFIGNFAIALTKLAAAFFTGASAMMAEAIHSFVDSGNQLLILYGLKRGQRPADAKHPFGYGMEIYFWSFIVAILLFSIGAGVSIYEGIERVLHPEAVKSPLINFIVLGLAFVFEGYALRVAVKETRQHLRAKETVFSYARRSKNAPLFTVLFEDFAAMAGIIIAIISLGLAEILQMPVLDGLASILIGMLLASAAIFLAIETKSLLIGEAAAPEMVAAIRTYAESDVRVQKVNDVLTMHLGPEDVLVALSLDFDNNHTAAEVEQAVSDLEDHIRVHWPQTKRIFIEAQAFQQHFQGSQIKQVKS